MTPMVQTIGYQNLSLEEFVKVLKKRGIKQVIDVRNNPFSFKPGFAKKRLSFYLRQVGLEYVSIPELGIPSKYRKKLSGLQLWQKYLELLGMNNDFIVEAVNKLRAKPTVLMCFEAIYSECHRSILAETLGKRFRLNVVHYHQPTGEWIALAKKY